MAKHYYVILFVIMVTANNVLISSSVHKTSPIIVIFISSLMAIIYFHVINYKNIIKTYSQVFKNKLLIFNININICIIGIWVLKFYSIQLSSAPLNLYAYFFMPLVLIEIINSKRSLLLFFQIAAVILPFLFFCHDIYGYMLGLLSGAFGYGYLTLSKKIYTGTDLTPTQSLMIRSWGIILLSGVIITTSSKAYELTHINLNLLLEIVFIGIGCFILQIWLSQKAIIQSGVTIKCFFSSAGPFTVYLAELCIYGDHNSILMFSSLLPPLFVYIGYLCKNHRNKGN